MRQAASNTAKTGLLLAAIVSCEILEQPLTKNEQLWPADELPWQERCDQPPRRKSNQHR